jgi:hypothetical protein
MVSIVDKMKIESRLVVICQLSMLPRSQTWPADSEDCMHASMHWRIDMLDFCNIVMDFTDLF